MRFAHYSPNPWHRQFLQYLKGFDSVINKCDKNCEFIWCGSASLLEKAFPASLKYKKPIIVWVWDLPTIFPVHASRVQMYVNVLKQCTKVIAASKATQQVLKKFGIKSEQMYFYANTTDLKPAEGNKQNQIIQVSRFTPHKQFEVAQAVVKDLKVTLLNVGRVNSEEFYYYRRLQENAPDNVIFRPDLPREEMLAELRTSKVLVTSSKFEGWGLSPIEALFSDVPVIVSDLPVFREQYGDSVLYHNPDDPNTLKHQLQKLLESDELQQKIVHNAKLKIAEYTPEKFSRRWTDLIERTVC